MKIVLATDVDGTLTEPGSDTIFDFFGLYEKKEESEELYEWSLNAPEKISAKYGIPLDRVFPSIDVEILLKQIITEQDGVAQSVFEKIGREARLAEGARELVAEAQGMGAVFFLTCAFEPTALAIAKRLGVEEENVFCTRLEEHGGKVIGFKGPVMEAEVKRAALQDICGKTRAPLNRFVGLGDSSSDAPFVKGIIEAGGLGLVLGGNKKLLEAGAKPVENPWQALEEVKKFWRGLK